MECRLEQINMGIPAKRRCEICGLFGRCTKGLDSHIPIPVDKDAQIAQLTAENERLTRVVEQAIELGDFRITHVGAGEYEIKRPDIDNWGKEQDYPDLFAQLKGVEG